MTKFRASALAWRGSSAILADTESVESGREILAWTLEALGSLYSDLLLIGVAGDGLGARRCSGPRCRGNCDLGRGRTGCTRPDRSFHQSIRPLPDVKSLSAVRCLQRACKQSFERSSS